MGSSKEIESLLGTSIDKLQKMVSVSTVVGEMVSAGEGVHIIPISKVICGFVAGGGEYGGKSEAMKDAPDMAFGGGSGAGMTVQPVGFLVIKDSHVQFLSLGTKDPVSKLIDMTPDLIDKLQGIVNGKKTKTDDCCTKAAETEEV